MTAVESTYSLTRRLARAAELREAERRHDVEYAPIENVDVLRAALVVSIDNVSQAVEEAYKNTYNEEKYGDTGLVEHYRREYNAGLIDLYTLISHYFSTLGTPVEQVALDRIRLLGDFDLSRWATEIEERRRMR